MSIYLKRERVHYNGINRSKIWRNICRQCEKIKNVARRVIEEAERGNDVVVVVSAMGKTTDEFVSMANEISGTQANGKWICC